MLDTQFIKNAYALVKLSPDQAPTIRGASPPPVSNRESSFPIINDKKGGRKKVILGVEVDNRQNSEKVPLKNTNGDQTKNSSEIFDSHPEKENRKDYQISVFPEQQTEIPDRKIDFDFSKALGQGIAQSINNQPKSKERIINLDELIESPTKDRFFSSPKFKFRSMRSGGNVLIFNRSDGGTDPVEKYNKLVIVNHSGRRIQKSS